MPLSIRYHRRTPSSTPPLSAGRQRDIALQLSYSALTIFLPLRGQLLSARHTFHSLPKVAHRCSCRRAAHRRRPSPILRPTFSTPMEAPSPGTGNPARRLQHRFSPIHPPNPIEWKEMLAV